MILLWPLAASGSAFSLFPVGEDVDRLSWLDLSAGQPLARISSWFPYDLPGVRADRLSFQLAQKRWVMRLEAESQNWTLFDSFAWRAFLARRVGSNLSAGFCLSNEELGERGVTTLALDLYLNGLGLRLPLLITSQGRLRAAELTAAWRGEWWRLQLHRELASEAAEPLSMAMGLDLGRIDLRFICLKSGLAGSEISASRGRLTLTVAMRFHPWLGRSLGFDLACR